MMDEADEASDLLSFFGRTWNSVRSTVTFSSCTFNAATTLASCVAEDRKERRWRCRAIMINRGRKWHVIVIAYVRRV